MSQVATLVGKEVRTLFTSPIAYAVIAVFVVLSGYTFTPSSRSYSNVAANQSAQNYTAAAVAGGSDLIWVEDALPAPHALLATGGSPGSEHEGWRQRIGT